MTSGASRKNERWEHTEGETVSVEGQTDKEKMAADPMFQLEYSVEDKEKETEEAPRIHLLQVRTYDIIAIVICISVNC